MGNYRHRRKSASDSFFDEMVSLPWWGSLVIGAIFWVFAFVLLKFSPLHSLIKAFPALWPIPALFGMTAFVSVFVRKRARIALKHTRTLQELKAVPWHEFERLAAAYYEDTGYSVVHTGTAGPDGGYDLVLRKDGERILVQCKKFTREDIGVQTLREFFGVVIAQGAHRGIFITTSGFTPAAMAFGLSQATLELISGLRFAQMVEHLRAGVPPLPGYASPGTPAQQLSSDQAETPCCPRCASRMVVRKAKRGPNPGQRFWACPQYPACHGTRQLQESTSYSAN